MKKVNSTNDLLEKEVDKFTKEMVKKYNAYFCMSYGISGSEFAITEIINAKEVEMFGHYICLITKYPGLSILSPAGNIAKHVMEILKKNKDTKKKEVKKPVKKPTKKK